MGYFCKMYSKKLPKESTRTMGENSPNVVTLIEGYV
jgi:hypothetical protein